jgi:hypothetical protein
VNGQRVTGAGGPPGGLAAAADQVGKRWQDGSAGHAARPINASFSAVDQVWPGTHAEAAQP